MSPPVVRNVQEYYTRHFDTYSRDKINRIDNLTEKEKEEVIRAVEKRRDDTKKFRDTSTWKLETVVDINSRRVVYTDSIGNVRARGLKGKSGGKFVKVPKRFKTV